MPSPRWQKVVRDLMSNKSRTILVVLAIAVGVFAFGSVFVTQEVLLKNIQDQYLASNASTVSIYMSDFDESLVDWTKSQSGVADAEGSANQTIKLILENGDEEILNITAIPDYEDMRINRLVTQKGSWPPQKGELVLERNSLGGNKVVIGDQVTVKANGEKLYKLNLVGSTYDNSSFPYIFTTQMTGFVDWDTLGNLGFPKRFNKINIVTSPEIKTLVDAEKLTYEITEVLRDRGVRIMGTYVAKPNQHWATDNSKAFTSILSVIGVFSLVLSGFLVINTISALLAQHKKQIGIMKAIGGSQKQITSLYLTMVGFYGILSLIVALPVGMIMGYIFLKLVTDFLNLDIKSFFLPPSVFVMEFAAALIVPTVAAVIPIAQGTKKTVREAISDYQTGSKIGKIDKLLAKITGISLPLLISLRNVFRKKGRLTLTLGTLVTAGALFMGVINVRTGMFKEMDRILSMFDFEVSISLTEDKAVRGLVKRIEEVESVTSVEARTNIGARRIKPDGTKGSPFGITGLPPDTVFSHPVLLNGRWLTTSDKDKIVLSSAFIRDNTDLSVGDDLYVEVENENYHLEIIGIIAMSENGTFSDFGSVSRIKDEPNLASEYLIKTTPDDTATQNIVADELEERLKRSGVVVANKQTKSKIYASAANQFNFLIFFLLAMAIMVAIVGGLGLAGTMSLNVMERTREIGIMRSIGASDAAVRKVVLVEGLLVGFISWLIAIPLSFPLTFGFCYLLGDAFFDRTLVFAIVPEGMVIWFVIVMIIAVIASLVPAGRASKMSISETLSYE